MGLNLPLSVAENHITEDFREPKLSRLGFQQHQVINDRSLDLVDEFGIRVDNLNDEITNS